MTHRIYTIFSIIIILFLYGCASTGVAPVANRDEVKEKKPTSTQRGTAVQTQAKKSTSRQEQNKSGYHIVEQGDTLYSIAWRYNFDYKEVANWNRIKSPYTIFPGQFIRLKPIAKKKGVALKSEPIKKEKIPKVEPKPKPQVKPVQKKQSASTKKSAPKPVSAKGPIKWSWPTRGKLVKSNSPTSKKGIDISGQNGQIIKAAAAGEVVYSGSGLLGYGKLIIIKHNDTFLSAYAYNSKLLVKEGDNVTIGQSISQMGQDHTGRSVLHFEIRKNGKPVDPAKHLPKLRT